MSFDLLIQDIRDVTPAIRQFTLAPSQSGGLPDYEPGAHIDFDLGDLGTRSYSLLRFPGDSADVLRVAVQREDDGEGGSRKMHGFAAGDSLSVSQSKNQFAMVQNDAPVLLLAGGIGVTPIIAMATDMTERGKPFELHFAARTRDAMAFLPEMQPAYGDALSLHFDDETPIDLKAILQEAADGTEIYVCGPKGMIEAVKSIAQDTGHAPERVHFELFSNAAAHEAGDQPFEVEINDGRVFTIPADKTIIDVLEDEGVDLMYDCQRGDCGICQCDIISGEPDHRDVVLSEDERNSGKVMQICVSRAKSARLVLDI